jgi:hypothetical protein
MANTYTAGTKTFDIDTNINVAGLAALKGSAPSSDEKIFVSNNAVVTVESNLSILQIYLGDNAAGTAGGKRGDLTVNGGAILTLYDTVAGGGFLGEGTLNVLKFLGTSESCRAQVVGNSSRKVSTAPVASCRVNAKFATFTDLYAIYGNNANSTFENVTFDNSYYGFALSQAVIPRIFNAVEFVGCAYSIYNASTANNALGKMLFSNQIKLTSNANGRSTIYMFGPTSGNSLWFKGKFGNGPMWDETTLC